MICIDRRVRSEPAALSAALADRARAEVRRLIESSSKELLAQSRIKFEPRVWIGAKPALVDLFNGKCAYCESDCTAVTSGDIEHFRPKMLGSGEGADRLQYYAWLTYGGF